MIQVVSDFCLYFLENKIVMNLNQNEAKEWCNYFFLKEATYRLGTSPESKVHESIVHHRM